MSYLLLIKKAEEKFKENEINEEKGETLEVREGKTIKAVKVYTHLFEDEIWLILDKSFLPKDGLACYYAEEFEPLKNRTPEDLKAIHQAKLQFPWARIIQEGPES